MEKQNIIVLTVYGKEKTISHLSVSLFDSHNSAKNYCDNINEFQLQDDDWVFAKIAGENEKIDAYEIPQCMDMKFLNNWNDGDIERLTRKIKNETWALILKNADEGTCEKIFTNMSKQRVKFIKEEMEYLLPNAAQTKNAQRQIIQYAHNEKVHILGLSYLRGKK